MNVQDWFSLGLIGLISLLSKGLSRFFSSTAIWKHQYFGTQPSLWVNSHIHTWLLEKPYLWIHVPLSAKWCLIFNMLSRFVTAFLPKSKHLLISWLQSPSSDFGAQEKKICPCFHFSPFYLPWTYGTRCHECIVFWMLRFKPCPLSPSSRDSLVPLRFLPLESYHLHIWGCWYFSWQSWFQPVIRPTWHFEWCTLHRS